MHSSLSTYQQQVYLFYLWFILRRVFINYGYLASKDGVMREWRNGKHLEENGRGLILRYYTVFAWKDWRKPRKPSVIIASLRAEIWTQDLPNTKQECQTFDHDVLCTFRGLGFFHIASRHIHRETHMEIIFFYTHNHLYEARCLGLVHFTLYIKISVFRYLINVSVLSLSNFNWPLILFDKLFPLADYNLSLLYLSHIYCNLDLWFSLFFNV